MNNILATNIVTAVELAGDPRLIQHARGISNDLRAISILLKEGLKSLGAWIQLYALMPGASPVFFETAAREMNRLLNHLSSAYLKLLDYIQQSPPDVAFASEMEQILDRLFQNELHQETLCDLAGFGWTSWSARIAPRQPAQWSAEMIRQTLAQITAPKWQSAQALLSQTVLQLC